MTGLGYLQIIILLMKDFMIIRERVCNRWKKKFQKEIMKQQYVLIKTGKQYMHRLEMKILSDLQKYSVT